MKINIVIDGPETSGKTTIARIISDALVSHGIANEVSDGDNEEFKKWQNDRLASLTKDVLVQIKVANKGA